MSETLERLRKEIQQARDALAPEIEGFHDLSMLTLLTETRQQVEKDLVTGRRREALMVAALNTLLALLEDGYPDLPRIKIRELIYNDIAEQRRTIDAALARYEPLPREASGGRVLIED